MELIIQILMLFIAVNCVLKLSFMKWWQGVIFGLVCGGGVILTCPAATQQSKTQLTGFLANPTIMQDMAVIVTLEAVVCFAYCFLITKKLYGDKLSAWGRVLQWYVSLLMFPVLFFVLTQAVYAMPGTDFLTIAWVMAGVIAVGFPLLQALVKWAIPEEDFRVEVHFLVSLFVCVLGLISTVNGNVTYAAVEQPFDWKMLVAAVLFFAAAFFAGWGWSKLKWVRQHRKVNK